MNFNSLSFLIFFSIVYLLYLILNHKLQNRMLLIASYYFYGSWNWRFLSLIIISTIIDYFVGLKLEAASALIKRKQLLAISITANLGILGVFKYYNFFRDSLVIQFANLGVPLNLNTLNIILPVGISFYTFQTMSYTIDIYKKELTPTKNIFDFALFVSFFPQLVAGPIERAKNLLPNVLKERKITYDLFSRGLFLILLGLFKKVVIADGVAPSVNAIFNSTGIVSSLDIILATYLFALQIYCDFSGYSDIARGLSKMMGFELMINFKTPYFSISPSEFWTRWHISLSSWLRDYLYIPLGGNKKGKISLYKNLLITMLLGGLWHGAAWNYVLWGLYQGVILIIYRVISLKKIVSKIPHFVIRFIGVLFFFQITCYGWLLFRANSFRQIIDYTVSIFTFNSFQTIIKLPPLATLIGIPLLLFYDWRSYKFDDFSFYRTLHRVPRSLTYALFIFLLLMGISNPASEFIYFQF